MMASRIQRHPEAFSLDPSLDRKRKREQNGAHLKFIRSLPCLLCETHQNVQAAHIRMPSPAHGKRGTGIGRKPDDRWTIPLCGPHHEMQHQTGEESFWRFHNIDVCNVAALLWSCTGDETMALPIIRARGKGKL